MTTALRPIVRSAGESGAGAFRTDVQGLRAVAVLAVVLDHLFAWPSGGFIGVDVFFVISGYLITGLMLREHDRSGRISWIDFYKRRIRRIMPAAVVCLAAVVGASYFIYRVGRFESIRTDAVWSLFFSSNWHFAAVGTDYFQSSGPVSPLQHFWSLAVEEQFYIVWPILLIFGLATIGRKLRIRGRSPRVFVVGVIVVGAAASFLWAVRETATSPTWAYFSTFARAWELAVGALLAALAPQLAKCPARTRTVLSYIGCLGIIVGLFSISLNSQFPGPWAALPVLSAGLVIAAGVGGVPQYMWLLNNRVSVYVGQISYSLYLWHFPVIVLLASLITSDTFQFHAIAIVMMAVLAIGSFHLVENPVRRSSWLDSHPPKPGQGRGQRTHRHGVRPAWRVSLAALAVVVVVVTGFSFRLPQPPPIASDSTAPLAIPPLAVSDQARLTADIYTALATNKWPDNLDPSIDHLGRDALASEWDKDGCLGDDRALYPDPQLNASHCTYGDPSGDKTAILLGDSVAISYLPGLIAALPTGWRIRVMTLTQCPVAQLDVLKVDGSPNQLCNAFRKWTLQQVANLHPNLVLISEAVGTLDRIAGKPAADTKLALWRAGMAASLAQLKGKAAKTVVLGAPPGGLNLDECATKASTPSACKSTPDARYLRMVAAQREAVAAAGAGFTFVPVQAWFCAPTGGCPAFIGSTTVLADGEHLTEKYSIRLGPVLASALLPQPTNVAQTSGAPPIANAPVPSTASGQAQSTLSISSGRTTAAPTGAQAVLTAQIDTALTAKEWPSNLSPTIDQVIDPHYLDDVPCTPENPMCSNTDSPAKKQVVILGDSLAWPLLATVARALGAGYHYVSYAKASCVTPPVLKTFADSADEAACLANRKAGLDFIAKSHPSVVIITNTYGATGSLKSGAQGEAAAAEWQTALNQVLTSVTANADRVILVSPPPSGQSLADCATKSSRPADCVITIPDMWNRLEKVESDGAAAAGAEYWNTSSWYCSASGFCPSFVGTTPVRFDQVHPTREYSKLLVPLFQQKFAQGS